MEKKRILIELFNNIKSNYIRMIILAFISFLSSILFARILGPNSYGTYSYMMWLTGTLATLLGLGLGGTVTKFLPEYYFNKQYAESKILLKSFLAILTISITAISIILIVTYPLWGNLLKSLNTNKPFILTSLAIANALPAAILTLFISSVQALQRFDIFSKIAINSQILGFFVSLIIILFFHKVEYLLVITFIFSVYQVIVYAIFLKKDFSSKIQDCLASTNVILEKKRIINYAKYMYVNVVWQQIVFTRSEYLFLGIYSGSKEIAIYGIAYGLLNAVSMIFSPIMNVLNNFFSALVARQEINLLENIIVSLTKYFIVLLLFFLTFSFTFSGEIINLIYSNQYHGVVECFLIMLCGFVILQGISVAGSVPFLYEKQKFVVNVGLIVGLINIILDIVLIPSWGSVGATIANSSTQVISAIIVFVYTINITKFRFNLPRLIPIVIVSISCCLILTLVDQSLMKFLVLIVYTFVYALLLYFTKIISFDEMKKILKGFR